MNIVEPKDNADLYELETWKDIINSDGWGYFKDLLEEHKEFLENQVLISVGRKEFDKASDYSSRADECKKILSLVDGRLGDLKQRSK